MGCIGSPFVLQTKTQHSMNTHDYDSALATYLDVSHVHELAQLSEEAFWNYAQKLADTSPAIREQSPAQMDKEYLECTSGKGHFLLSLAALYEIVPPPRRYTDLPDKPVWMAGLAAWRGSAIVVVDLTLYLTGDMVSIDHAFPESLLIAHAGDVSLGLLVHSNSNIIIVNDMLPMPLDDVHLPDTIVWYLPARHTIIMGKYADAIVLDVPALLADIVRQIEIAASHG